MPASPNTTEFCLVQQCGEGGRRDVPDYSDVELIAGQMLRYEALEIGGGDRRDAGGRSLDRPDIGMVAQGKAEPGLPGGRLGIIGVAGDGG